MFIKKCYTILKPINLYGWKSSRTYDYDELEIKVEAIYLLGLILIYKKQDTISIQRGKSTYGRPKTKKLR